MDSSEANRRPQKATLFLASHRNAPAPASASAPAFYFNPQGKAGPAALSPRGARNSGPAPSARLRVAPHRLFVPRQRNRTGPRSLPRSSFTVSFSPSPRSLFYVLSPPRKKKNCFPCAPSPRDGMGTGRGKTSQRKQVSEHGPRRDVFPSGHWVRGAAPAWDNSTNFARTVTRRSAQAPRTLAPARGADFPPRIRGGRLRGNWPRGGQRTLCEASNWLFNSQQLHVSLPVSAAPGSYWLTWWAGP